MILPTLQQRILLLALFLIGSGVAQDEWNTDFESVPETENVSYSAPETAPAQDATYVIKKGDTLWDLAFEFLGTPYQWPRIWELNNYIKNPDLIYPGDRLNIPGRDGSQQPGGTYSEAGGEVLTSETEQILEENANMQDSIENSSAFPDDTLIYSALKNKTVFSKAFLAKMPFLWTEKDQTGNIYPGNAVVEKPEHGASYQPFSTIIIKPFKGVTYSVGDTVDILSSIEIRNFNNHIVNLVKCVGRARITEAEEKKTTALLFEMYDPIVGKERVAPATPRKTTKIDTLVAPDIAITANVFTRVEKTVSPYPLQKIILDKGSMQGVALGDLFGTYYRENKKGPARLCTIGTIGHVGAESSTLIILFMADNKVSAGDKAVLLRRARFADTEL